MTKLETIVEEDRQGYFFYRNTPFAYNIGRAGVDFFEEKVCFSPHRTSQFFLFPHATFTEWSCSGADFYVGYIVHSCSCLSLSDRHEEDEWTTHSLCVHSSFMECFMLTCWLFSSRMSRWADCHLPNGSDAGGEQDE